ncbi:MAG: hypothetical protein LCH46_12305 [Proteobacteria bacterium]|nr:hypothetical protein [Pseudomonadota bacterium]
MDSVRIYLAGALSLFLFSGSALSETAKIEDPKWKGYGLDWCLNWGASCGKPVADKYCQAKGYEKSTAFQKWENPGFATRLIGSNQVCDETECDSFASITCSKPDEAADDGGPDVEDEGVGLFIKPKAGSRRLDWCLTWATNCGKPAAEYFCKSKGYDKVVKFKIDADIGKTRILKTSQNCTDPSCDGFKEIICQ